MTKDDEITVLGAKKNITSPVKIKNSYNEIIKGNR